MARCASRNPAGRGRPVPAYRSRATTTRRRRPTVASPARTTGSRPRSSVHDEHNEAAHWTPLGRPGARARNTSLHASSPPCPSGGSGLPPATATAARTGSASSGSSRRPSAPSIHAASLSAVTISSTMACSYADAAPCDSWGSGTPVSCSTTRGPANPMVAPSTAARRSHSDPYDANAPPVVGDRCTAKDRRPRLPCSAAARDVRAIWMSATIPSCMRAPPDAVNATNAPTTSTA